MIKPARLKKGDKVAIVSLSSGIAGDTLFYHRYELGKKRLEDNFGLNVITMPNALLGSEELYLHPELRAKDLMDAFKDKEIKAIFCNLGGLLENIDLSSCDLFIIDTTIFTRRNENSIEKKFCKKIKKLGGKK